MTRRFLAGLCACFMLSAFAFRGTVRADGPVNIAYTSTIDYASLFLAKDRGFFKQAGVDPTLTLVGISATLPAALFAGSFQIGATTATAFLQAVDSGLDLVAVGNTTLSEHDVPRIGLLTKKNSGINGPRDLVGKKMSVAGIGSGPYVLVRKWLIENKVDIKSVQYIETSYPSMGDALRSGSVDAVLVAEPYKTRIMEAGDAKLLINTNEVNQTGQISTVYIATRAWAASHMAEVRAFQAGLRKGSDFGNNKANQAATRALFGTYVKLPPEVLETVQIPKFQADLTPRQLGLWVDIMNQQSMLQTKIDPARLIIRA